MFLVSAMLLAWRFEWVLGRSLLFSLVFKGGCFVDYYFDLLWCDGGLFMVRGLLYRFIFFGLGLGLMYVIMCCSLWVVCLSFMLVDCLLFD